MLHRDDPVARALTGHPHNLREAHVHLPLLAQALSMVDLSTIRSIDEALDVLHQACAGLDASDPQGQAWLLAQGLRIESFAQPRWPTRQELDALARRTKRPVMVLSFDYHSLVANSAALACSGIRDSDPDPRPDVGVMVRDSHGRLTGLLLEGMARKVRESVPELAPPQRRDSICKALAQLEALGFAEVHDMLAPPWLGPLLAQLHDEGQLATRVGLYTPVQVLAQVHQDATTFTRPGRVELLGGKIFIDGTLNARTAWMLHPFADPIPNHPRGTPLMTQADIAHALAVCQGLGLGLACHAIGDAAVRAALDADASVTPTRPARQLPLQARVPGRLRIEHCELIDPSDVPRFARQGVVASVQPCHLLYDIEVLHKQCSHALDRVLPLRDLIDAGLVPGHSLVFGSDVPIVRANPQDSVLAAVHRARTPNTPGGPPTAAIAPRQALRETEAWACFA